MTYNVLVPSMTSKETSITVHMAYTVYTCVGGVVASWLVCLTTDRVVQVRALARDIVLCSWARHFTLTVPLSTHVHKWVPENFMLGPGNPALD